MKRVHFCLSIEDINIEVQEVFEFPDDISDNEIEDKFDSWKSDVLEEEWWEE